MQVSEFKAWFDGFTEDMTKLPTVKQWSRIKARIEEIDGVATTERIFHDHYWRPYSPYWPQTTWTIGNFSDTSGGVQTISVNGLDQLQLSTNSAQLTATVTVLTASQAFTSLGKAEAASISAGISY